MGGMGGLSGLADKWVMNNSVSNLATEAGKYDSGCASGMQLAGAALGVAGNAAMLVIPGGEEAKGAELAGEGGLDALKLLKGPCFIAGTPVQMADGSTKPIEQVKVGDWVKTRDPATRKTELKPVTKTFTPTSDRLVSLEMSTGETITCTPEHPFYVPGQGFEPAGSLSIGSPIETQSGPSVAVSGIKWLEETTPAGFRVYNFEVQDDHTYFVGKDDGGVWVHNDCTDVAAKYMKQFGGDVWKVGDRYGKPFQIDGEANFFHDVVRVGDKIYDPLANGHEGLEDIDTWMSNFDKLVPEGDGTGFEQYFDFAAGSGNPAKLFLLLGAP
jgi:hypothetical protein